MTPFPCTQCGLCCQHVHPSEETRFLDRGDGTCRHYSGVNRSCAIYDTRPDICRVDRIYTLRYAERCTWDAFIQANLQVCGQLETLSQS